MTFKTIAGTAMLALALAHTAFVSNASARQSDDDYDGLDWCVEYGDEYFGGGEGNLIGCCDDGGCMICEEHWTDCHYEEAYSAGGAGGGLPDSMYDGPITMPLPDVPTRFNH